MPRPDYRRCKQCKRHADKCGPLSHTRLCAECGLTNQTQAIFELAEHYGDTLTKWRRGMVASAGGVILDDVRSNP